MMFVKKENMFLYVKHVTLSILVKKIVTIVVYCLSCVKCLVNLFGVAGTKEIFSECNREHLRSYYSNSYNEFYFHSDSEDTDFSDNDHKNEELITNQF